MRLGFVDGEQLAITKIKNLNKAANAAIVDPSVGVLVRRLAALAYNLIFGIADLYEATATSHAVCEHGCGRQHTENQYPANRQYFHLNEKILPVCISYGLMCVVCHLLSLLVPV